MTSDRGLLEITDIDVVSAFFDFCCEVIPPRLALVQPIDVTNEGICRIAKRWF